MIIWDALFGGMLIGCSALILLLAIGKIAGVSGAFSALIKQQAWFKLGWQHYFIAGIALGSGIYALVIGIDFEARQGFSLPLLVISGILVGFGTKMANGCTSGHGICGIARLSPRSIIATVTFMLSAIVTVLLVKLI